MLILPPRLRPSYSDNLLECGVGRRCIHWLLKADVSQCKVSSAGHELERSTLPGHLTFPTPVQNYRIFTYFIFVPPKGSNQVFLGSLLCLGLVTVQNWLNPYFGILLKSRQLWDDLIRICGTKRSTRVQWLRIGLTIQAKRVQSQFYHEDKLGETTQSKNQQKI